MAGLDASLRDAFERALGDCDPDRDPGARRRRRDRLPDRHRATGARSSARPTRRRRRTSSRPRPPDCGGSTTPMPCRSRRVIAVGDGTSGIPVDRVDRRGRPARVDRPRPRRRPGAPASTPERRRSGGRTGGPPAVAPCRTTRATRGSSSTPNAGCCRSPGSLPTAQRCRPQSIRRLERRGRDLERVGGPPEPPARLHGDLWAGNRHRRPRRAQLADRPGRARRAPRVRPRDDATVRRLLDGVLRRVHGRGAARRRLGGPRRAAQIAPLVVHTIKFGGGYVAAAEPRSPRYT